MYRIAHLSDLHLAGDAESRQRFDRAVAYVRGMTSPPDAIVLTGDIIEAVAIDEYAYVVAALAPIAPTFACPGNSDRRAALRAAFAAGKQSAGAGDDTPVNDARTIGTLTVIMLDSSVPGHYHGALDATSLAWLRATLAGLPATQTIVIGLHHPPVELGHPAIDPLRLLNADPFAAIVRDAPQVAALLVGHTHAATATTFAGRPLLVAPGIHSGLHLPWEPTAEGQPLIDGTIPPALAIHLIDDERRITTYYRTLS